MNEDLTSPDLYDEFVECFFEKGEAEVPAEWPEDVRERCLFFAKVFGASSSGFAERCMLSLLGSDGVKAELTLAGPDLAPPPGLGRPSPGSERYVIEREIAHGGMGRVVLVYDRDLRRRVAMKELLLPAGPGRASRFVEEAQATAQLEHPNIGPVYDVGLDASRAPFFTMKWIRGRNLEEVLRTGSVELSLIRLVQILQQAAMGVDFAHSRGVVHRDLKPQNVMVGDYGEVLVVDWGLAKILGRDGDREEAISTARADAGVASLDGAVQGSIPYMSPEQARGEVQAIDARTDVFGLGAILYRILAGGPLYPETDAGQALARARRCDIVPPSRRSPGRTVPAGLEEICVKALALRPGDRFQSARELHDAIQRHVEGIHDAERRAREAGRLLAEAQGTRESLRSAEEEETSLARRTAELRESIADHDPRERKSALWALLGDERAARDRSVKLFGDAAAAYRAVLKVEPDNKGARSALADLYFERLRAAEERGDQEASGAYQGLVDEFHDGRYEVELRGEIPFSIDSEPRGAAVFISRYEERGLALVESERVKLGVTPLERPLPGGSYLAVLENDGFSRARYPFVLERGGRHTARVKLHPAGTIPEGFIQVPAGESIVGGDPEQLSHLPRSRRHIEETFVAEFPVTFGEYVHFLNESFGSAGGEVIQGAPAERWSGLVPSLEAFTREEYVTRGGDGLFVLSPRLHPRMPVMSIPYGAVLEYCAWLGGKLGRVVRTPSDAEWERCARGADGRVFPWGHRFDWSFTKGGRSRPGRPFLEPVGAFPEDVSPFGVRDLAGTIREVGPEKSREGYRLCRGGSWYNLYSFVFRADARTMHREEMRAADIGFRVCFSGAPTIGGAS